MRIRNFIFGIKNWIRKNPVEFWVLFAILIAGAFCRLYKIDQYMTFLGDEGRDVIIVRRIFTELHPPLIGPGTSVGRMYLGPLYYYMTAIPLLVSGFSPVGPAVMVALLGVVTIAFIWWAGRTWFGRSAGLIAAGLYAISPTVITFSHSSWNPDIMPFFALLSVYSVWKVWRQRKLNWLIVLGVSFAFVLQSHYLGLLLAPTLFIFWLSTLVDLKKNGSVKPFVKKSLMGLGCFLFLMSPLLIFDLRHNFMNSRALYQFILERDTTISGSPWQALPKLPSVFNLINGSLLVGKNALAGIISSVFITGGIIYLFIRNFFKHKNFRIKGEYILLLSWIAFGLFGLALYKQSIYDHYLGFLFPVPFFLVAIFLSKLLKDGKVTKALAVVGIACLIVLNLLQNPFRFGPNRQLQRAKDVSAEILTLSGGKPFNFAVIAERNYEDGYRYFLELWGGKVLHADRWDPSTISDTLFVVCENDPVKCDPARSPKAEVANFGMSVIKGQWNVDGVIIYKLAHAQ